MARIIVGLSGGVDSAVSAALLKKRGFDVTGVFIKIWQPEFIECTWREDRLDAMRVAAHLGIPFREVDFSEEYKKEVVDGMVADYARGVTPNPDVLCNSSIKFGHFLAWAHGEGAEKIATGHYARIREKNGHYELLRGLDENKDQSYFLWQLGQKELSRSLFPIGELKKGEVRELARKFGLPNAEKHDSQGLCFVGDVSMKDFLARFIPLAKGDVLDISGKKVGEHDGAALYTVGQRHGFTSAGGAPHYVVALDSNQNTITVSEHRSDAEKAEILVRDVSWVDAEPGFSSEISIQARYREVPVPAHLEKTGNGMRVRTTEPHLFSAGQSLVVYGDETCLGGGIVV